MTGAQVASHSLARRNAAGEGPDRLVNILLIPRPELWKTLLFNTIFARSSCKSGICSQEKINFFKQIL